MAVSRKVGCVLAVALSVSTAAELVVRELHHNSKSGSSLVSQSKDASALLRITLLYREVLP
jgi:hypothetical protein